MITTGMLLLAGCLAAMSFMDSATPYLLYGTTLFLMAAGMGLCLSVLSTGIMSALPPARAGIGSGLNSASRELGSAVGVAVVGTIMNSRLGHSATFTEAMSVGYRTVAAVVLIGACVVAAAFRD